MSITGDLAKEYCTKYASCSSNEIASTLFSENPLCFRDKEHARSSVRYYRGASGDAKRKKVSKIIERITIPKSDSVPYVPYEIKDFPVAVCGDMHMPYHDVKTIEMFLEHADKIGAKTILLAGDCLDCYQTSRWCRDPRMRSFPDEVAMMKQFLIDLHKAFPKAKIVYKVGNHEERYEKYLKEKAPELFGLADIQLQNLLGANEDWIDWVDDKRVITAKKLNIIHGHEYTFSMSNPVNPARGLYLRAKKSSMCFHFHQTSEHTETAINGDMATCWSVGCMCELNPQYMPLNKWNHGFADIVLDKDGSWMVHNYRVYKGKVL